MGIGEPIMELTNQEAEVIKEIYNAYYSTFISADEALHDLEVLINGNVEELLFKNKEVF
jgi:hypothetical protein